MRRFYFCFGSSPDGSFVVVTDADIWDNEQRVDDSEDSDDVVPAGFDRITESTYEYPGTEDAARAALVAAGHVESREIGEMFGGED